MKPQTQLLKEIEKIEKQADADANNCSCKDRSSHLPENYDTLKALLQQNKEILVLLNRLNNQWMISVGEVNELKSKLTGEKE
jgi:hypothetical protein